MLIGIQDRFHPFLLGVDYQKNNIDKVISLIFFFSFFVCTEM